MSGEAGAGAGAQVWGGRGAGDVVCGVRDVECRLFAAALRPALGLTEGLVGQGAGGGVATPTAQGVLCQVVRALSRGAV